MGEHLLPPSLSREGPGVGDAAGSPALYRLGQADHTHPNPSLEREGL
jgi:hypothetical protein